MSYYRICPDCGSYLDPCERCDCQDPEDTNKKAAMPASTAANPQ